MPRTPWKTGAAPGPAGITARLPGAGQAALAVALAAAGLLLVAKLTLRPENWGDWQNEARPAVDALVAGHVMRFLQLAPTYGGSLILRAPFVMLTKLWHGHEDSIYRAGVVPCLAAAGALGAWVASLMRARGGSWPACALAILLVVANPLMFPALTLGHPEEILGAALCAAAVLFALGDRPAWAAIMLGLAIANKEWAVLAVGPVLVALPRARIRALIIAGAVAGAVLAPLMLAGALVGQAAAAGLNTGTIFQPWQIWWWLGAAGGGHGYRLAPVWLGSFGHTLPLALMPPLTGLYAWQGRRPGRRRRPQDALLLLALLLGLRCLLDPWDISYYALPFLVSLLSWEALTFARAPLITLGAAAASWYVFSGTSGSGFSADVEALVFALVSVPALLAVAAAVYAPGAGRLMTTRVAWPRRPRGAQAAA